MKAALRYSATSTEGSKWKEKEKEKEKGKGKKNGEKEGERGKVTEKKRETVTKLGERS